MRSIPIGSRLGSWPALSLVRRSAHRQPSRLGVVVRARVPAPTRRVSRRVVMPGRVHDASVVYKCRAKGAWRANHPLITSHYACFGRAWGPARCDMPTQRSRTDPRASAIGALSGFQRHLRPDLERIRQGFEVLRPRAVSGGAVTASRDRPARWSATVTEGSARHPPLGRVTRATCVPACEMGCWDGNRPRHHYLKDFMKA